MEPLTHQLPLEIQQKIVDEYGKLLIKQTLTLEVPLSCGVFNYCQGCCKKRDVLYNEKILWINFFGIIRLHLNIKWYVNSFIFKTVISCR